MEEYLIIYYTETLFGRDREWSQVFDINPIQSDNKRKHNFRSLNIKDEIVFVKNCLKKCLKDIDKLVPAFKIYVQNPNEESVSIIKQKNSPRKHLLNTTLQN